MRERERERERARTDARAREREKAREFHREEELPEEGRKRVRVNEGRLEEESVRQEMRNSTREQHNI